MIDYMIMTEINDIIKKSFVANVLNKYTWRGVEITKKQITEIKNKYPKNEFKFETATNGFYITITTKKKVKGKLENEKENN